MTDCTSSESRSHDANTRTEDTGQGVVVIGHHRGLPKDPVTGADLLQGAFLNRGSPHRNVVNNLHNAPLAASVGVEPTSRD